MITCDVRQASGYDAHADCTDPASPIMHYEGGFTAVCLVDGREVDWSPMSYRTREAAEVSGASMVAHQERLRDPRPRPDAYERLMIAARPGELAIDPVAVEPIVELLFGGLVRDP